MNEEMKFLVPLLYVGDRKIHVFPATSLQEAKEEILRGETPAQAVMIQVMCCETYIPTSFCTDAWSKIGVDHEICPSAPDEVAEKMVKALGKHYEKSVASPEPEEIYAFFRRNTGGRKALHKIPGCPETVRLTPETGMGYLTLEEVPRRIRMNPCTRCFGRDRMMEIAHAARQEQEQQRASMDRLMEESEEH